MWWIKRKLLPSLYWNRMLAGAQHERRFIPGMKG
jgi:sulfide:quinone oxidoreductase